MTALVAVLVIAITFAIALTPVLLPGLCRAGRRWRSAARQRRRSAARQETDEPAWWPEFEREFRAYARGWATAQHRRAGRRRQGRES